MLALTGATIALSVYLYVIIPKGFFPQQDIGRLSGTLLGAQDISFPAMQDKLKQYLAILAKDPASKDVTGYVGGGAENTGTLRVELKPLEERKLNADQIIARLRPKLAVVPGASLFLMSTQDVKMGARSSSSQYQYTLQGDDVTELEEWAPRVLAAVRRLPGIRDISSDQQDRGLQATLVIDRDTASRLGIPRSK